MSPYDNLPMSQWKAKTNELIANHPLDTNELVEVVLEAWEGIMKTKIAGELQIGVDIFPSPQILGNYMHELIPAILRKRHPGVWGRDIEKSDKDLVYLPDPNFSIEIKTSSNPNNVFGNRSYGQEGTGKDSGKSKSGYYITVNFEKFNPSNPTFKPSVLKVRFGWIDHDDWKAQKAATGQQASLPTDARDNKLKLLYTK